MTPAVRSWLALAIMAAASAAALHAAPAAATFDDGSVVGFAKLIDRGPDSERLNIVLVAEGYRSADLPGFRAKADAFAAEIFHTAPFDRCDTGINVWRLDVASTDAGADDPAACTGGTGASVRTYFDATYCGFGGIRRGLTVAWSAVTSTLNDHLPAWDAAVVVVNSTVHGGSALGAISVVIPAAGWEAGSTHELGHSIAGLADEYDYFDACGGDYGGAEPVEANVTIETERERIKWSHLIGTAVPIPTLLNPACGQCSNLPSPIAPQSIGLFEGARYHTCGLHRPAHDCRMRNGSVTFCAVCQERFRQVLATYASEDLCPCRAADCNDDAQVTIDELVLATGIGLGTNPLWRCAASDTDRDGKVEVTELIQGITAGLGGCPHCPCDS